MADWHTGAKAAANPTTSAAPPLPFTSRRSPVLCTNGCVSSSQPLATSIGLQILRDRKGNAADAAVAVAAALAVTEPCSTGLGGDMFALYYDAKTRRVSAINGSGRAPANLTLDVLKRDHPAKGNSGDGGIDSEGFRTSVHAVTVPGAARGWEDFLTRHGSGRLRLSDLVEPAAVLAEEGFPVGPVTAYWWNMGMPVIRRWHTTAARTTTEEGARGEEEGGATCAVPLSMDGRGRGPQPGELFRNPDMASVLRSLGRHGARDGFYRGPPGRSIVDTIRRLGGTMTMADLETHKSTYPDPICAEYRGTKLWQVPPNGQGIAGLIALKGLAALEGRGLLKPIRGRDDLPQNSAPTLHAMIEMMRLGFGDARSFVCDPDYVGSGKGGGRNETMNDWLLDTERIAERAVRLFDPSKAVIQGEALPASGTVSFQVVDGEGNAVSFVNSNFMGFGTGIVPDGCGFTLQNRGYGFSLDPAHPNALAPSKRPYHTIIPGMLTHADTDELYATLSNMGGYMQPQGHMQLTVDLVAGGLDPQTAVDMPRFCIADGTQEGRVMIEEGVSDEVIDALSSMGHNMTSNVSAHDRSVFGRAQIIKKDRKGGGVLWAGSDGRADGCACGY